MKIGQLTDVEGVPRCCILIVVSIYGATPNDHVKDDVIVRRDCFPPIASSRHQCLGLQGAEVNIRKRMIEFTYVCIGGGLYHSHLDLLEHAPAKLSNRTASYCSNLQ